MLFPILLYLSFQKLFLTNEKTEDEKDKTKLFYLADTEGKI